MTAMSKRESYRKACKVGKAGKFAKRSRLRTLRLRRRTRARRLRRSVRAERHARGRGGGRRSHWRRRDLLFGLNAFLDSLLLTITNQPAQHLRLDDSDQDVVDRFVDGRIADQTAGSSLPGIQLCDRLIQRMH